MMNVTQLSAKYFRWMVRTACYSYIIYRLVCMGMRMCGFDELASKVSGLIEVPMEIATVFVFVTGLLFMLLWRLIARTSPESLTTFYNASSGLRMLLALAVITTYYFVCGQEAITPMALVFMAMYFLQLIVHSAFFTKYLK